jgi:hypothetical protein
MTKQNRVNPFGEIIATPERGTFMGNRGMLHDDEGHVKRLWQVKRWLVCVLEFRGRKRKVMTPNRYTELFFLSMKRLPSPLDTGLARSAVMRVSLHFVTLGSRSILGTATRNDQLPTRSTAACTPSGSLRTVRRTPIRRGLTDCRMACL